MVYFGLGKPSREQVDEAEFNAELKKVKAPQLKARQQQMKATLAERKLFLKARQKDVKRFRAGIREFGGAAAPIPIKITQAQQDMYELFGGGEKIWGNIQEPVEINHDLNPRRRGDYGTGEMFGF